MLHDCLKQGRHIFVFFVQLTHGNTVLRASVNDWKIELLVGGLQFNEKIENHVDDLMRPCVFSVDLVNYDDWLEFVFKRLAQNKTRLRLRPVVGVDNQQVRRLPFS